MVKKTKTSKVFMAFAAGKESTEGAPNKKYIGVAPVFILGVNPGKAELEKLFKRELENAPEYVGKREADGVSTDYVRLDFIIQTDSEKSNGIDLLSKVTFFLSKTARYNKDKTKVQVINKYGETAWLTPEEIKTKTVPENMSWFDASDIRVAFSGESELTDFIKAYLNIPNKSYRKKTGEVVVLADLKTAEARLDKVENYFKGDVSELKEVLKLQPKNKVKVRFGVKTSSDNKQYQTVDTRKFLKNNVTDYSKFEDAYQPEDTEFSNDPIREYVVESTDFTKSPNSPFPDDNASAEPWFNK